MNDRTRSTNWKNQIRFGIERFQPIPRLKAVKQEGEATGEQRAQRRGLYHILICSPSSSVQTTPGMGRKTKDEQRILEANVMDELALQVCEKRYVRFETILL